MIKEEGGKRGNEFPELPDADGGHTIRMREIPAFSRELEDDAGGAAP